MLDDVMTLNEADNPAKECRPDKRFIYPVRYALSHGFVAQVHDGRKSSVGTPTSISSLDGPIGPTPIYGFDHTLRRVREGYVYMVYDTGEPNLVWQQYRVAYPDKTQIPLLSPTADNKNFGFHVCTWKNGDSDVFTESGTRLPFLEVPKDVTKVWIGYTPIPWPRQLIFELSERVSKIRPHFMSEVNFANDDPNTMNFKDKQSWDKIPEFSTGGLPYLPGQTTERNFHLLGEMYNEVNLNGDPILAENVETLRNNLCEADQEDARIVALRDDLAEAEAMAHVHSVLADDYLSKANDNRYALQIGAMAESTIKQNSDLRKYYRRDFESELRKIRGDVEKKNHRCGFPVMVQNTILTRRDEQSNSQKIHSLLEVSKKRGIYNRSDLSDYICYLAGMATLGMSSSEAGVEVLCNKRKGISVDIGDFWTIFDTITGAYIDHLEDNIVHSLGSYRLYVGQHANVVLERTIFHKYSEGFILRFDEIARASGVSMRRTTVNSADELIKLYENDFILRAITRDARMMVGKNAFIFRGEINALTVSSITELHDVELTQGAKKRLSHFSKLSGGMTGFAMLLGSYQLFDLQKSNDIKSDDFYAQLIDTIAGLVQGICELTESMIRSSTVTDDFLSLLGKLSERGGAQGLQNVARQLTRNTTQQVAKYASYAGTALRVISMGAAIISAGVSFYQFAKAGRKNDDIAAGGYLLAGVGAILLLVPGLQVFGLVLIVIGTVMTFFTLTPLEIWASGCFWGRGGFYIYWDNDPSREEARGVQRDLIFNDQLKKSYALASKEPAMVENLEREIYAFWEVASTITFQLLPGTHTYMRCPLFESQDDCNRLTVKMYKWTVETSQTFTPNSKHSGTGTFGSEDKDVVQPIGLEATNLRFVSPGIIEFYVHQGTYSPEPAEKDEGKREGWEYIVAYNMRAEFTSKTGAQIIGDTGVLSDGMTPIARCHSSYKFYYGKLSEEETSQTGS